MITIFVIIIFFIVFKRLVETFIITNTEGTIHFTIEFIFPGLGLLTSLIYWVRTKEKKFILYSLYYHSSLFVSLILDMLIFGKK